jgi:hypothetical protein
MKLTDTIKIVNMSTGETEEVSRSYKINIALIEMKILGIVTTAQENSIGEKLDRLFLEHKGEG